MSDESYDDVLKSLRELRAEAGSPTFRAIARQAGVSHTVVADLFKGKRVAWRTAERIIRAMSGEPATYRDDWPQPAQKAASPGEIALLLEIRDELRLIRQALESRASDAGAPAGS